MNKIIAYLNNNYIELYIKDKYYKIKTDSIKNGQIIKKDLFIKDIKNKKIFSLIITNDIDIYINYQIYEKDIIYYNHIFQELNCIKINVKNTLDILDNNTLIVNELYILFNNKKFYIFEDKYLNYYIDELKINHIYILSDNKIKLSNSCKYYYYNSNNILNKINSLYK